VVIATFDKGWRFLIPSKGDQICRLRTKKTEIFLREINTNEALKAIYPVLECFSFGFSQLESLHQAFGNALCTL
jgi:hypothetical protein